MRGIYGQRLGPAGAKKRILEAAERIFEEEGYSKSTVRKVAAKAGLSVGTIYFYYKDKEELYTALFRRQLESFSEMTEPLRRQEPVAALRGLVDFYLDYAVKKAKLVSMQIKEYDLEIRKPLKKAFFDAQKKLIADILERGIKQKVFRQMDCRETASALFYCLRGMILAQLSGELGYQAKGRLRGKPCELFLNGLLKNK
ncbi:MAG: TetR/AcrR family transcriptional regulator [Nitrospiraceae bacterium]|nr:TetR/AcrR family transcriptional regulator [Nitrospiraceae bacterium]